MYSYPFAGATQEQAQLTPFRIVFQKPCVKSISSEILFTQGFCFSNIHLASRWPVLFLGSLYETKQTTVSLVKLEESTFL